MKRLCAGGMTFQPPVKRARSLVLGVIRLFRCEITEVFGMGIAGS
jgi:hypothetical protein